MRKASIWPIFALSLISCKEYNAHDIFNLNIDSIVEIKCSSDSEDFSFGTGILYKETGLLLTNSHVLSRLENNFDSINVRFVKEEEFREAVLIKKDDELDLAILKIEECDEGYKPITFSNRTYTYGDKVYAIGNTSNYGIGISEGVISVPEVFVSLENTKKAFIQVDINVSNGNSGGALVNDSGELIGITTLRTKDVNGNVNYGFVYCIPLKEINNFILN